ncbi:hypothetical protein K9857_23485 [Pseudomonas sp. REP124]|uniref:hypothetical protein n=1 Tax=Pseudomonas sp. REP124 TaxID=2875731 RepID=UPI001CCD50D6|nr:hypothetical protein [Pseudomonas sp. REP124]MBZ9784505.1 hypothetical protein [Pseudomonas sp. REP124]
MLAMVFNDNAGNLTPCGAPSSIASKLAPTGIGIDLIPVNHKHLTLRDMGLRGLPV